MHWLIQERFAKEEQFTAMIATLNRFDIPYTLQERVVPFVGELIPDPQIETDNVICMGSVGMRHAAKKRGWWPGVYDMEPFGFDQHLEHWGFRMLNSDSIVVPFGEAKFEGTKFIRPAHDTKAIVGGLMDWDDFGPWQKRVIDMGNETGGTLTALTPIQVSTPKQIYAEYRFFVVDGRIATGSMYKFGDRVQYMEVNKDHSAAQYAEECLKLWQPLPAFTLDIADTPNGFKIIETNTINSSGMYAIDVQSLVLALEEHNRGELASRSRVK